MSNLLLHRLNVFRLFEKISLYIGLYFVKSRERMECSKGGKNNLLQNVNDELTYQQLNMRRKKSQHGNFM